MSRRTRYTPEEIDTALSALILIGHSERTAEQLKEQGLRVSGRLLRTWREKRYATRYAELQRDLAPQVAERVAARAEQVALRQTDLEEKLVERLEEELPQLKPSDLGGTLRNVTTSKALQFDRISGPVRGRPAQIIEHRDPTQILRELKQLAPSLVVDSTAEEIPTRRLPPG